MPLPSHFPTPQQRVKVYEMCRDEWTDKGTGFCSGDVLDARDGLGPSAWLVVRSEENRNVTLLRSPVRGLIRFQKQQETLLMWSEPGKNDMALSFQDAEGCSCVCNFLVQAQKSIARDISVIVVTSTEDGETSEVIAGPVSFPPSPDLSNLREVLDSTSVLTAFQFSRDALCTFLVNSDFIPKLAETFTQAEQQHLLQHLHNLCRIVKLLFGLNDTKVIECLVDDKVVMGSIGALEYDPSFPTYKANLRAHFRADHRLREVIPFNDPEILAKIKLTSRLQLLKDVLARLLDENTFNIMSSMIYFNQCTIVMSLQSSDYFKKIFTLYMQQYPEYSTLQLRRDGVRFMHSISLSTKSFPIAQRQKTFVNLFEKGLFALLQFAIADTDNKIRMLGTELLAALIELEPQLVRNYVKVQIEYVTNTQAQVLAQVQAHQPPANTKEFNRAAIISQLQKRSKGKAETVSKDTPIEKSQSTADKDDNSKIEVTNVKDNSLLQILVNLFMSNTDIGLRLQVLESLKFMLDNTETDANTANMFGLSNGMEGVLDRVNDQFVKRFYERYADDVFGILREAALSASFSSAPAIQKKGLNTQSTVLSDSASTITPEIPPQARIPALSPRLSPQYRSLYEQVCDLLKFCIRTHGARCQDYMAGNQSNELRLTRRLPLSPETNGVITIPTINGSVPPGLGNSIVIERATVPSLDGDEASKQLHSDESQKSTDTRQRQNLWKGIAVLLISQHQTIQLAALRCVRQAINLLDESDLDFEYENYEVFFEGTDGASTHEQADGEDSKKEVQEREKHDNEDKENRKTESPKQDKPNELDNADNSEVKKPEASEEQSTESEIPHTSELSLAPTNDDSESSSSSFYGSSDDSHYALQLILSGCLDSLVDVLLRTRHKTNLVNSACLEVVATIYQRAKGIVESIGLDSPGVWNISGIINGTSHLTNSYISPSASTNSDFNSDKENFNADTTRPDSDEKDDDEHKYNRSIPLKNLAKLPGNIALACYLVIKRGIDLKKLIVNQTPFDSNSENKPHKQQDDDGVERGVTGRMEVLEELLNLIDLISMQSPPPNFHSADMANDSSFNGDEYDDDDEDDEEEDETNTRLGLKSQNIGTAASSAAAAAVAVAVGRRSIGDDGEFDDADEDIGVERRIDDGDDDDYDDDDEEKDMHEKLAMESGDEGHIFRNGSLRKGKDEEASENLISVSLKRKASGDHHQLKYNMHHHPSHHLQLSTHPQILGTQQLETLDSTQLIPHHSPLLAQQLQTSPQIITTASTAAGDSTEFWVPVIASTAPTSTASGITSNLEVPGADHQSTVNLSTVISPHDGLVNQISTTDPGVVGTTVRGIGTIEAIPGLQLQTDIQLGDPQQHGIELIGPDNLQNLHALQQLQQIHQLPVQHIQHLSGFSSLGGGLVSNIPIEQAGLNLHPTLQSIQELPRELELQQTGQFGHISHVQPLQYSLDTVNKPEIIQSSDTLKDVSENAEKDEEVSAIQTSPHEENTPKENLEVPSGAEIEISTPVLQPGNHPIELSSDQQDEGKETHLLATPPEIKSSTSVLSPSSQSPENGTRPTHWALNQ